MQVKPRARLQESKSVEQYNLLSLGYFTEQLIGISEKHPRKHKKDLEKF
jgi:hypothetical protein